MCVYTHVTTAFLTLFKPHWTFCSIVRPLCLKFNYCVYIYTWRLHLWRLHFWLYLNPFKFSGVREAPHHTNLLRSPPDLLCLPPDLPSFTTHFPTFTTHHPTWLSRMGCCSSKPPQEPTKATNQQNQHQVPGPGTGTTQQQLGNIQNTNSQNPNLVDGTRYNSGPPIAQGPASNPDDKLYVALYAYQARTIEDLSFEKGEHLVVTGDTDKDWYFAKSLRTQRQGHIPSNYVAPVSSFEAEEWVLLSLVA